MVLQFTFQDLGHSYPLLTLLKPQKYCSISYHDTLRHAIDLPEVSTLVVSPLTSPGTFKCKSIGMGMSLCTYTCMHMTCVWRALVTWRLHLSRLKVSRSHAWPLVSSRMSYTSPPGCYFSVCFSSFLNYICTMSIVAWRSGCVMHKCALSKEVSVSNLDTNQKSTIPTPLPAASASLSLCFPTLYANPIWLAVWFSFFASLFNFVFYPPLCFFFHFLPWIPFAFFTLRGLYSTPTSSCVREYLFQSQEHTEMLLVDRKETSPPPFLPYLLPLPLLLFTGIHAV